MSNEAPPSPSVLDEILCTALAVGVVIVAIVPGARGMSVVGWLPMWLVAMPALAWWASHGFAVPRRSAGAVRAVATRSRRAQPQARRHARPVRAGGARQAA